ncbi:alpha-2-macroglobulin family protein [Neolewinella agarilytica]|uniref:alpha-2-macroglobulin family protein n=1 Tax=Neolewinella agarilytica TaxID=478744 RepID=UPI00235514FF|nr:MG2 domain-containing protein [Neolewinella agarilytica]
MIRPIHILHLILSFLLIITLFPACDQKDAAVSAATEAVAIPAALQAHTSGVIGRGESIYVQFAEAPEGEAADLISVSPATKGTASMAGNTLTYTPEGNWAAATSYRVRVKIAGEEDFVFSFSTPERRAEVITDGVYIPKGGTDLQITGRVVTNDASSTEEIGRLLSAKQGGKTLDVVVEAGADALSYTYTVLGPDRGKSPEPVTISYDGEKMGFKGVSGELSVAIPASDDFRVENLLVDENSDGAIVARFSDALDPKQNFKGLVTFNTAMTYTTSVDGNLLKIYPKGDNLGEVNVTLTDGIKNTAGVRLGRAASWKLNLGRTEPMLRTVGEGAILPHTGKRLFPFEAVGVQAVRIELVQIFANNINQYLQDNSLASTPNDWTLRRVGKIVVQERIELSSLSAAVNSSRWTRYAIDLGKYIKDEEAAIYQIRLGFTMEDAVAGCEAEASDFGVSEPSDEQDDFSVGFTETVSKFGDYYGVYGYYDGFDWDDRKNPCMPAYYNRDKFITQNIISSNLGLIAKRNPDKSTLVFATDLISARPREGVRVRAYSYQQQELYSGTTDASGRVLMTTEEAPALITADLGDDVAYLDLNSGDLSMSRFDISGTESAGGIKGAFYTERGVWRPGDEVFLNFVLQDRQQRLPDNYPVEFVLQDAQGRVVERRTVLPAFKSGGLYPLPFTTKKSDVTGNWTATVNAGGKTYRCPLMIETVKPNRLSIDLILPAGGLSPGNETATLNSKWLYGAPASNLKAEVLMNVSERSPDFPKWGDYVFLDPARELENLGQEEIFSGTLDESGNSPLEIPLSEGSMPGPLYAGLSTKVFEPGGNFSIDNQRIPVDPYAVYAGVRLPEGKWGGKRVALNGGSTVEVGTVNTSGEAVSGRKLNIGLYRVNWRYWWQDNNDNVARLNSSRHTEAMETYSATTNSNGSASVKVEVPRWGRYLLRVCDEGGHCTGDYFYAGYNQQEGDRESASLLQLKADNPEVAEGQQVNIKVPTSAGGSLLVSLETGAGSIEQFWVEAEAGETTISFEADERMVPTVYANVSLLQPYEQTTNDRPVRLYGTVPIKVTDPATVLTPELTVADEWKPRESVTVSVTESGGKDMNYTLAVVDEGLLGLTRFQTPDLHDKFYAKEAMSVRTYDLYKFVIGSLNGEFGKVLAIGGDGGEMDDETQSANRFEPVVRHLGPFQLAGGKTGRHEIELPNYVGAVRLMVVASSAEAFGTAAKRIPVRQPLMLLPTLPRVLGPGERVDMPVNVFAMTDKVRNVSLNVAESAGLVNVGSNNQSMSFSAAGDQLAYFPLQVGDKTGIAKFSVSGSGNGESASQEVEIDVRHPNEITSRSSTVAITAGSSETIAYENFGLPGTQEASLELSSLPAMQLDRHLRYLLRYPYGCVEQTTSPAFAQLYLDKVTELTPAQEKERRMNVNAGLQAMRKFQTSSGGMGYWPGDRTPHPWASNYVMHFLIEAERAGFSVPQDLKKNLMAFQGKAAGNWRSGNGDYYVSSRQRTLDQAYRLYGLALGGKAEIGAMNRLKGAKPSLSAPARFQLAAAYAIVGQKAASADLISGGETDVKAYRELGYTFGSDIRDMSIILEGQLAAGQDSDAGKQAFRLAERISKRNWLSTQEAAFAFVAIGKMSEVDNRSLSADFTLPGVARNAVGAKTGIYRIDLPTEAGSGSFTLKNTGTATLYATVVTSGKARAGEEETKNENLVLSVTYTDDDGNAIDVSNLPSGTDFVANYTVKNPGTLGMNYRQLALKSLLPSGWEVSNDRLSAAGAAGEEGSYLYRDFRDDRVYTFFHLNRGETKNFALRMTATYPGRYYLPTQVSEAMYANDVKAAVKGRWVEVSK